MDATEPTTEEIFALVDEINDALTARKSGDRIAIGVSMSMRGLPIDWSNQCLTHQQVWDELILNRNALNAPPETRRDRARRAIRKLTHRP